MLTIEEKIARSEHFAKLCAQAEIPEWQEECEQLAAWLRELVELRKERDYWQEKANSYEQTIFKLTDAISKQPEIIRCKDCKHKGTRNCVANALTIAFHSEVKDDFYCGLAERRTDG